MSCVVESTILETAFKKETIGLVSREEYVEKRVTIKTKMEEEEKEKLQKLLEEEARLELEKRKKKKRKTNHRLSFAEGIDGAEEELDEESKSKKISNEICGELGKDPTVETSFLPDSCCVFNLDEPLQITYSYWDGRGHRGTLQVRKGDTIGAFLRAVQQQLAHEFREVRTTFVENLLYVKEDLIIPHQLSFYVLIINKARGKSGPLFHFDVHEDVQTIADATIEKDELSVFIIWSTELQTKWSSTINYNLPHICSHMLVKL